MAQSFHRAIYVGDKDVYEAEEVLKRRKLKGGFEYLIKWQGFSDESNSWVTDVTPDLRKAFNKKQRERKKKRAAAKKGGRSTAKTTTTGTTSAPAQSNPTENADRQSATEAPDGMVVHEEVVNGDFVDRTIATEATDGGMVDHEEVDHGDGFDRKSTENADRQSAAEATDGGMVDHDEVDHGDCVDRTSMGSNHSSMEWSLVYDTSTKTESELDESIL